MLVRYKNLFASFLYENIWNLRRANTLRQYIGIHFQMLFLILSMLLEKRETIMFHTKCTMLIERRVNERFFVSASIIACIIKCDRNVGPYSNRNQRNIAMRDRLFSTIRVSYSIENMTCARVHTQYTHTRIHYVLNE